ncbi:MAG: aminopeptidase [Eubacteriales bacterium]|nr:aminopeptidase [Eubacteriales bacterium]
MEYNENVIEIDYSLSAFKERYELSIERIKDIDYKINTDFAACFREINEFILLCDKEFRERKADKETNTRLFKTYTDEEYESSYLNPQYANKKLGKYGELFSVWYMELRGLVPFLYEERIKDMTVMLETHIQIYNEFEEKYNEAEKLKKEGLAAEDIPEYEIIKDVLYSYMYDYCSEFVEEQLEEELTGARSFAREIVMNAELSDLSEHSYLYKMGEWITDEELKTAEVLNALSKEQIVAMASAYTEGYIKGFEMTGKDVSRKSTVVCYLPLGLERFMREAIKQFEARGLKVIINRNPVHLINRRLSGNVKPGFYGAVNRQLVYDHKNDMGLFQGDRLNAQKLQALRNAYECFKEAASLYSGNACVEIFGEEGFVPVNKKENVQYTEHQIKCNSEYLRKAHEIADMYKPDEETSFCIIAWPRPHIADNTSASYREIFEEFIRINTLPVEKWQHIQQKLIDTMDQAEYIHVKGKGKNSTNLRINLRKLNSPESETNFENCLADVNIPVGEVFTTPELKGTNGKLFVTNFCLGEYIFKNIFVDFKDGIVADYGCDNFADKEEGRRLIETAIFKEKKQLPMGEFAIGTNTAAYSTAKKYDIFPKLPVLIAEKTGPHFAVGDTCYSHEEELVAYNPDGKRITARENAFSILRNTEPEKAYFNVHVDITLPYDEIEELTACLNNGEKKKIIEEGRFVLDGTKELNEVL